MKYYIYAIIAIILVLGGYFVFSSSEVSEAPAVTEPIIVSMIKKTVYLHASSTKTEIIEPSQAAPGDLVETLNSGRALIQLQNGTLTAVDYSTKLIIKTHPDDEHTSMRLESGKVWSTVKKVFGKGEYYEIETQNAVAVVRGTSFGVSFDGVNTILEVTEGAVLSVPIDAVTGERLFDRAILVPAGKKAIISNTGAIEILDLTSDDKTKEWYIFNNGNIISDKTQNNTDTTDVHVSDLEVRSR